MPHARKPVGPQRTGAAFVHPERANLARQALGTPNAKGRRIIGQDVRTLLQLAEIPLTEAAKHCGVGLRTLERHVSSRSLVPYPLEFTLIALCMARGVMPTTIQLHEGKPHA